MYNKQRSPNTVNNFISSKNVNTYSLLLYSTVILWCHIILLVQPNS